MSESEEPTRKRRKVPLACAPCRERKIRCSGEKPVCASCHRRSEVCSYAVRLESITLPGVTESIQSVLDRLQRLENQSQSNHSLASGQNVIQSRSTVAYQQTENLVIDSGDRSITSFNAQRPSETSICDRTPPASMPPETQPSNVRNPRQSSSNMSYASPIDEATESPFKSEEYESSHELLQIASTEADAMGVSSVCDENSPQESTQYYGGSSGIAFMREIGHVLGDRVPEDHFMDNASSSTDPANPVGFKQSASSELLKLLPKYEGPRFRPQFFSLPSRSLSDALLENYWTRVYPLYPFVHRPTFESAYATLWNPAGPAGGDAHLAQELDAGLGNAIDAGPSKQIFFCALNMMLALGSQFLDISVSERNSITAMFEQRSKNLLVIDMMDRGSIAVVQALLLNGQYLQSTFYPQRCWNCIGVACRIAQGLGLHADQAPLQKTSLGQEVRRRVWYACMMLDMSGSMTMGRPLMILHKFSTSLPSPLDDEKLQSSKSLVLPVIGLFLEGIKLSKTLGIILTTIYNQNISHTITSAGNAKYVQTPTEIDALLELDKRLNKFQSELPVELRWTQDGEKLRESLGPCARNLEMQANVLHASFLQSRILLYRTTFIQLCQDAVSKLSEKQQDDCTDSELDVDTFFVTRGAVSCVSAARELIKLIHRTSESTSSGAWWYNVYSSFRGTDAHTAGMVVKLAQLCNPLKQIVNGSYLDQSWALCRDTLSKMSSYGQVPRRCLEGLEAIQQKISQLELANSGMKSHFPKQGNTQSSEFDLSNFQEPTASNGSRRNQISHGQGGPHPQTTDDGAYLTGFVDNTIPLTRTTDNTDGDDKTYNHWSTDLPDLWSFPGGEFEFDHLAFKQ